MGSTLMWIFLEEVFGSGLEMSPGMESGEETGILFLLDFVEQTIWRDCFMWPLMISSIEGGYLEVL